MFQLRFGGRHAVTLAAREAGMVQGTADRGRRLAVEQSAAESTSGSALRAERSQHGALRRRPRRQIRRIRWLRVHLAQYTTASCSSAMRRPHNANVAVPEIDRSGLGAAAFLSGVTQTSHLWGEGTLYLERLYPWERRVRRPLDRRQHYQQQNGEVLACSVFAAIGRRTRLTLRETTCWRTPANLSLGSIPRSCAMRLWLRRHAERGLTIAHFGADLTLRFDQSPPYGLSRTF